MRKVIGIGETVLDIIFKNGKPIEAVPGGSSFNAVISLGRAGVNASFISEAGNDRIGEYVIQFLRDNGVNADNVSIFPESKSPLSLAFLDENNNADYIFYKDHPHDQLEFATPEINPGDIVLFGSFFALNPVVRPQVAGFLEYAKNHGAILYYDINFRASHQNEIMKITPNLIENLEYADFVRGSHEDFEIDAPGARVAISHHRAFYGVNQSVVLSEGEVQLGVHTRSAQHIVEQIERHSAVVVHIVSAGSYHHMSLMGIFLHHDCLASNFTLNIEL